MSILQGALLGLIQGLGEFLPISSSGHLLLARLLLQLQTDTPAMKMLDIILHLGTLIPVLIVFRKEWLHMIAHPIKDRTLLLLVLASLPTLIIYIAAKVLFKDVNGIPSFDGFDIFNNGWFLGASFLITALLLLLIDMNQKRGIRKVKPVNAVVMGIFQGIGMIPGVSRSGSTISGGTLTGLDKKTAASFSFMMSMPAIVGSFLMEGKDAVEEGWISEIDIVPTLCGVVVAAVVGFLAIRFMLRIIEKVPMGWFALYMAAIGVVYLIMQLSGVSFLPAFSVTAAVPAG